MKTNSLILFFISLVSPSLEASKKFIEFEVHDEKGSQSVDFLDKVSREFEKRVSAKMTYKNGLIKLFENQDYFGYTKKKKIELLDNEDWVKIFNEVFSSEKLNLKCVNVLGHDDDAEKPYRFGVLWLQFSEEEDSDHPMVLIDKPDSDSTSEEEIEEDQKKKKTIQSNIKQVPTPIKPIEPQKPVKRKTNQSNPLNPQPNKTKKKFGAKEASVALISFGITAIILRQVLKKKSEKKIPIPKKTELKKGKQGNKKK